METTLGRWRDSGHSPISINPWLLSWASYRGNEDIGCRAQRAQVTWRRELFIFLRSGRVPRHQILHYHCRKGIIVKEHLPKNGGWRQLAGSCTQHPENRRPCPLPTLWSPRLWEAHPPAPAPSATLGSIYGNQIKCLIFFTWANTFGVQTTERKMSCWSSIHV